LSAVLGWVGIAAVALALTACGKKEEAAPSAGPAATAGKSAAQIAVEAAKPLCEGGKTITIVWEAGLQSLDPLNFSGPKWEQETAAR
jgi:multiple sugar transport system substrate-binding protein